LKKLLSGFASRLITKLIPLKYCHHLVQGYIERYGMDNFAKANGWDPKIFSTHPNVHRVPPGHWHSVYPDVPLVEERWNSMVRDSRVLGVSLEVEKQLELAEELQPLLRDYPYKPNADRTCIEAYHQGERLRYFCNSDNKSFQVDSVTLYAMLRHYKPRKVIEVGSGYSSAIMLDVRELERLDDQSLVFIEPYNQQRLFQLLKDGDRSNTDIIEQPLWEVNIDLFKSLTAGDLLFIDSSHMAKIGSDVYDYIFRILPQLNPGVIIHIHDITPHFEMARPWFKRGLFWNEGAFLKAFLMYNSDFEVLFHSSFLRRHHPDSPGINVLQEHMENTFFNENWKWANSFYLRRKS
jgi:predicted O-methyltransferase YrrM